ncbi:hypothetical protein VNO77_27726 [Canavalia gladiata]|uniref:Uncharacterized protein n=1 Tax=Canavalia gladiata TaxID=3824 RepID=A0AAN9Q4D5_CANGL
MNAMVNGGELSATVAIVKVSNTFIRGSRENEDHNFIGLWQRIAWQILRSSRGCLPHAKHYRGFNIRVLHSNTASFIG